MKAPPQAVQTNESFRSNLPQLKLPEFSGDPIEWPEWAGLFQVTVHAANITDSTKMQHLETLVTGKDKEANAGLGFLGEMYHVAWNILVNKFGNPRIVVNAQLKKVFSKPPVKMNDLPALIRYSTVLGSCVNVLISFQYDHDLHSESVVSRALRKLRLEWSGMVQSRGEDAVVQTRNRRIESVVVLEVFGARSNSSNSWQQPKQE